MQLVAFVQAINLARSSYMASEAFVQWHLCLDQPPYQGISCMPWVAAC